MMCRWEEKDSPGKMILNWHVIARETGWKPSKCRRVLSRISSVSKIELNEVPDGNVEFLMPKWLELQSSWGGKREARFDQDAGRSKKLEVRSKNAPNPATDPVAVKKESEWKYFPGFKLELYNAWVDKYGTEFVREEISKADLWCLANKNKAPKSDFNRFMNGWLSRNWETHRKKIASSTINLKPLNLEDIK